MTRPAIFFRRPVSDRWFKGDHVWRGNVRRLLRGPDPVGGIECVYVNLIKGLNELGVDYVTNIPFCSLKEDDKVGIIGVGRFSLDGYDRPNPILAGVAVAEHPMQWPTLFDDFPVARYVVHSKWVAEMYEKHYGPRVSTWAVGIDVEKWKPSLDSKKNVDFLIYDKIMWNRGRVQSALVDPIIDHMRFRGLSFEIIRYGQYKPTQFRAALDRCRSMLFLCEHETQGLAYQEAMACNLPILAWDPGQWLDPWRFRYGETFVPSTSVPFFEDRCGVTFAGATDFGDRLDVFLSRRRAFDPRSFVVENLTLAGCAQNYLDLLSSI